MARIAFLFLCVVSVMEAAETINKAATASRTWFPGSMLPRHRLFIDPCPYVNPPCNDGQDTSCTPFTSPRGISTCACDQSTLECYDSSQPPPDDAEEESDVPEDGMSLDDMSLDDSEEENEQVFHEDPCGAINPRCLDEKDSSCEGYTNHENGQLLTCKCDKVTHRCYHPLQGHSPEEMQDFDEDPCPLINYNCLDENHDSCDNYDHDGGHICQCDPMTLKCYSSSFGRSPEKVDDFDEDPCPLINSDCKDGNSKSCENYNSGKRGERFCRCNPVTFKCYESSAGLPPEELEEQDFDLHEEVEEQDSDEDSCERINSICSPGNPASCENYNPGNEPQTNCQCSAATFTCFASGYLHAPQEVEEQDSVEDPCPLINSICQPGNPTSCGNYNPGNGPPTNCQCSAATFTCFASGYIHAPQEVEDQDSDEDPCPLINTICQPGNPTSCVNYNPVNGPEIICECSAATFECFDPLLTGA